MKYKLVDNKNQPLSAGFVVGDNMTVKTFEGPTGSSSGWVEVSDIDVPGFSVAARVPPESFGCRFVPDPSESEIEELLAQAEEIKELQIYLNSSKFSEDPTVQVVDVLTRLGLR
jgi:hypothetical protein